MRIGGQSVSERTEDGRGMRYKTVVKVDKTENCWRSLKEDGSG